MNCFLCLKNTDSVFNIFKVDEGNLDIPGIIEKYICIKPEIKYPMICEKCWTILNTFHQFCLEIKLAHKSLTEEIKNHSKTKEISTNDIKNEESNKFKSTSDINSDSESMFNSENIDDDAENSKNIENVEYSPIKKTINKLDKKNKKLTERSSKKMCTRSQLKCNKNEQKIEQKNEQKIEQKNEQKIEQKNEELESTDKDIIKCENKPQYARKFTRKADEVDDKISKYMTLTCELCTEPSPTLASLKEHFRSKHKVKGYAICCNKKFTKRFLLLDHINCHLNPSHFKCELCDKTFSVKDSLKKHVNDLHQTEQKTYYCNKCPKKFIRKVLLSRHEASHLPQELWKFACADCTKVYPSRFHLTSHRTFAHNIVRNKLCYICAKDVPPNRYKKHMQMHDSNYEEEKVECEICKRKFNRKYINIHRQHHKEAEKEEFFCTICNHQSPNKRALYIHMRYTHAELRNHECHICHKTFKRKLALRQHMATHTGNNLYICPYCPKTFTYDSNFYNHKKKEHPKEMEIEKQKKKRTNFIQHMKTQRDEIPKTSNQSFDEDSTMIDDIKDEIFSEINNFNDIE